MANTSAAAKPQMFFAQEKPAENVMELYLLGVVGDYWDDNDQRSFITKINEAKQKGKNIHIKINSPGGYVHDGLAIFNELVNSGLHITTEVIGLAASMAGVIFLAGHKRIINENCQVMVHSAWNDASGNAAQLRELANILDQVDAGLAANLCSVTGQSAAVVAEWMSKDSWFTASDSLAARIATEVRSPGGKSMPTPSGKAAAAGYAGMRAEQVYFQYYANAAATAPSTDTPPPKPITRTKNLNLMNIIPESFRNIWRSQNSAASQTPAPAPAPAPTAEQMQAQMAQMQAQINALTARNAQLEAQNPQVQQAHAAISAEQQRVANEEARIQAAYQAWLAADSMGAVTPEVPISAASVAPTQPIIAATGVGGLHAGGGAQRNSWDARADANPYIPQASGVHVPAGGAMQVVPGGQAVQANAQQQPYQRVTKFEHTL